MEKNKSYRIIKVDIEDERLKHRLFSLGISEGKEIIYKGQASEGVEMIKVMDFVIALSTYVTDRIEVEEI